MFFIGQYNSEPYTNIHIENETLHDSSIEHSTVCYFKTEW